MREHSCRSCGYSDPAHVHRYRRRSKGTARPAFIIDTMLCLGCGSTWKERMTYRDGAPSLDSPKVLS